MTALFWPRLWPWLWVWPWLWQWLWLWLERSGGEVLAGSAGVMSLSRVWAKGDLKDAPDFMFSP